MLFKVIPTEEEMTSVNAIDCADDQLAKPEMLVRLMSKIPNVAARLECWLGDHIIDIYIKHIDDQLVYTVTMALLYETILTNRYPMFVGVMIMS
jgi:hypothetical protein